MSIVVGWNWSFKMLPTSNVHLHSRMFDVVCLTHVGWNWLWSWLASSRCVEIHPQRNLSTAWLFGRMWSDDGNGFPLPKGCYFGPAQGGGKKKDQIIGGKKRGSAGHGGQPKEIKDGVGNHQVLPHSP